MCCIIMLDLVTTEWKQLFTGGTRASKCYEGNNDDDDLLTDPLGGSSLLIYVNYNYKINRIKLFTNYTVETGLMEISYSKTN